MFRRTSLWHASLGWMPNKTALCGYWARVEAVAEGRYKRKEELFLTTPAEGNSISSTLPNMFDSLYSAQSELPIKTASFSAVALLRVEIIETGWSGGVLDRINRYKYEKKLISFATSTAQIFGQEPVAEKSLTTAITSSLVISVDKTCMDNNGTESTDSSVPVGG